MPNQPQTDAARDAGQHTPGPWFLCEQVEKPHHFALVGIGNGAVHVGYASVTPAMSPFEAEANARLIAAAPELLAACKAALADLYGIPSIDLSGSARVVRDYLRSAIEKATQSSP